MQVVKWIFQILSWYINKQYFLPFSIFYYIQTVNNVPKFIQIKKHSPESIKTFKMDLINSDIYDKLNKDNKGLL